MRRAPGASARRLALAAAATVALALCAPASAPAGERGAKANFLLRCSGCHGQSGAGDPAAGIPSLPGEVGVFTALPEGRLYLTHVPGIGASGLDHAEIAAVLNYVMDTYAGASLPKDAAPFTQAEVAALRGRPVADVVALRRSVAADLRSRGIAVPDYPWP